MTNKKFYIAAVAGTILAFTSAFAITAFAEDHDDSMSMKSPIKPLENMLKKLQRFEDKDFNFTTEKLEKNAPATMTINPQGNVRITNGRVTAVSGDIVTVEIWKLGFSVHNMADTQVFAGNKRQLTFAQIAVGDMVDVLGRLDAVTPAFIHAQMIHDRSQINPSTEEQKNRMQALITDLIQRLNAILAGKGLAPLPTPSFSPSASASPSPSSSPSPSLSPSASPSPSISPSPSASPSPSSSPSPSASASPSPSASASPSPSPSSTPH